MYGRYCKVGNIYCKSLSIINQHLKSALLHSPDCIPSPHVKESSTSKQNVPVGCSSPLSCRSHCECLWKGPRWPVLTSVGRNERSKKEIEEERERYFFLLHPRHLSLVNKTQVEFTNPADSQQSSQLDGNDYLQLPQVCDITVTATHYRQ